MTALDDLAAPTSASVRLVDRVARGLAARFTRRSFLAQTAVVGSALVVDPKGYVLTPGTAYASVCGPDTKASAGYTVFCCTVNGGKNSCPPGTFTAGWWKAADSSWCCGGYRYIVDCNATCTKCSSGCSGDHICDTKCWNCSCGTGSSSTCDQRRHCCNAFRYGQCNTHVRCSGGVACRVVSCVAPYTWDNCTTTSLTDNATAEHNAPCLQGCGPILTAYDALGAQGSPLGSSRGPERPVGDGKGRYVRYDHGSIHWTSATGAHAVFGAAYTGWQRVGGARGELGYPTAGRRVSKDGRSWSQSFQRGVVCDSPATVTSSVVGAAYTKWAALGRETGSLGFPRGDRIVARGRWYQQFEHGAICDSSETVTTSVYGAAFTAWAAHGRENGALGFPTRERVPVPGVAGGWYQQFQRGAICDSAATATTAVLGAAYTVWSRHGRETGELGFPTRERADVPGSQSGWSQQFQHGVVCDSATTVTSAVTGAVYTRWVALGRERGDLGFPRADARTDGRRRGRGQAFTGGELWALAGKQAFAVTGAVLRKWLADDGPDGTWGYPLSDVTRTPDGAHRATFEGGVLTA